MNETHRIQFLVQRDGLAAACEWVTRTRNLYRNAIESGTLASTRDYRPLRSVDPRVRGMAGAQLPVAGPISRGESTPRTQEFEEYQQTRSR
jgi:hypothetical protein